MADSFATVFIVTTILVAHCSIPAAFLPRPEGRSGRPGRVDRSLTSVPTRAGLGLGLGAGAQPQGQYAARTRLAQRDRREGGAPPGLDQVVDEEDRGTRRHVGT